jgi:flagellar biosynthetic protein FlhB
VAEETDKSERSEDPTQKKLEEAHKRGDVAKSQEVNTWFVILASTVGMGLLAPHSASQLALWCKGIFVRAGTMPVDSGALRALFMEAAMAVGSALLLPLALIVAAGIASNLVQHRPVWSLEPVTPKASKISPLRGFKRLFLSESLANFLKGILKLLIVGALMVVILWPEFDRLDTMIAVDVNALLGVTRDMSLKLLIGVVVLLTFVAGADFLYQRHRWFERQKMSVREVKEEFKQTEGDPAIKAKLREIRLQKARKRMMAKVPEASVIVTNPTHYSIALKYEAGMAAPVCLAKGTEAVALRIREVARENEIPIIENPPLARALYAEVELDRMIPEAHYRAVAEVIGFVMRQRRRGGWRPSR